MGAEQIVNIIFIGFLVLTSLSVLYQLLHFVIMEYRRHKNRNAPVYTERAVVFQKHTQTDTVLAGIHSSYVYYITFHTDFGEALKLYMTRDNFYIIEEGTAGQLTWQGNKLWEFIPDEKRSNE